MCRHKLPENDPKYLPVNKYKHISYFIEPSTCPIQTPNYDTLYSNSILDLTKGYVKLIIPKKIQNVYNLEKKYYSIQLIDISGNNVGFISLRNNINEYGHYYIINKNNLDECLIHMKTDLSNKVVVESWFLYIILRVQVDFTDEVDYTNTALYQQSFDIQYFPIINQKVELNHYLRYDVSQQKHVSTISITEFYKIFKHCYQYHVNFKYDSFYTDFNENGFYLHTITYLCKSFTKYLLNRDYKGWISRKSFDNMKLYMDENIFKTMISWKYLYAIDNMEAVYYMNRYDNNSDILSGENIYILDCVDEFQHANCFWSLSSYDYDTAQFIKNISNIYSKGNNINKKITIILSSKKLDNSYMKYINYKIYGQEKIDFYTLYVPEKTFYLVMRIYYPKDIINQYQLPHIKKISFK